MADNEFWVNPKGLARSAEGFTDKEREILSIVRRITALGNPTLVATATGNDGGGRQFLAAHLDGSAQVRDYVHTWATAVGATGTGIHNTAKAFGAVDGNTTEAAERLRRPS
jgi:hypothetical protein